MPESPIAVVAIFTAAPGRLDDLRAALVEAIPAVHEEQGCELYAIHDGPDDKIWMIEKWTTVADLDAHGSGQAVARLGQLVAGLTSGPAEVIRVHPIAAGAPAQGLL